MGQFEAKIIENCSKLSQTEVTPIEVEALKIETDIFSDDYDDSDINLKCHEKNLK